MNKNYTLLTCDAMTNPSLLDLIEYDDFYTELRRVSGKSVDYYHWHQCLELLYIESGIGLVIVDNQKFTLRPGRLFIFPQSKLHKVKVDSDEKNVYTRTIIHVDPVYISAFIKPFREAFKKFTSIAAADAKVSIYDLSEHKALITSLLSALSHKYTATSQKGEAIALFILNILGVLSPGVFISAGVSGLLSSKIMAYIEKHHLEKITLEDIARSLDLSRSYACRAFKKETGGTIQEYLIVRRVKHACYLLEESELSIAEVAAQSGFNYVTYFIRCFNLVAGVTPLQYKKGLKNRV